MRKILLLTILTLGLTGCGWFEREMAKATGYSKMCIDGVLYYQMTSGATVAYDADGAVKRC